MTISSMSGKKSNMFMERYGFSSPVCSYSTLSSRPPPWTKRVKLRSSVTVHMVGRMGKFAPSKHSLQLRGQPILLSKGKSLKVFSFKGNAQNEVDGREDGSKFSKKPVQLSCSQQEREETIIESSDVKNYPLSYASEDREGTITGSPAIQNLFKKWLIMLRTQSLSHMDEIYMEKPAEAGVLESQHGMIRSKAQKLMKATLVYFMKLDAAIKVPPLIFIPWYLMVKVVYGAEVTKELTPLWVLGPLIVALYIKIVQGLCSLYLYCFKQTVRLLMNLPTYYSLVSNYILEGKLNAYLHALFWQPLKDIKNLDYTELLRQKLKQLQEWAIEKYLDYRESIWPYYCRTIRFLKKANLI